MDDFLVLEKANEAGKIIKAPDGPVRVHSSVSKVENRVEVVRNQNESRIVNPPVKAIVVSFRSDQASFPVTGKGIECKVGHPLIDIEDPSDILKVAFGRSIVESVG